MNSCVSIIITCFNQEAFIEQCLQSVMDQTYTNWECIIVNDGSTDSSESICEKFCQADKRFKYIYQQNKGVSVARNTGYINATGNFIQFLDGDDYLATKKLEIQMEFLADNPHTDVCYGNHRFFIQSKNISTKHQFKIINGEALHELLYDYDNGVSIPIHAALLRKKIWSSSELPFNTAYNGRYEDWVFWVEIALKKSKFSFIDYDLVFYRIHDANFCANPEVVKANAINAMHFIANLLPQEERTHFIETKLSFFEHRYLDSVRVKANKTIKIVGIVKKVKSKLGSYARNLLNTVKENKEKRYIGQLRAKLTNKDFSIISNNCWGGGVYEDLGLPYTSPTIGLYFFAPCYIKFISNLPFYLNQPLHFINQSKYSSANAIRKKQPYPIGILDNSVEIHFLHYYTKREAQEKWSRRKQRVHLNNLFISFTDNEPCTLEEIKTFENLKYPKLFFSAFKIPGISSLVWLKQFEAKGKVGDLYSNKKEYRKYFDVVEWLNAGYKTKNS